MDGVELNFSGNLGFLVLVLGLVGARFRWGGREVEGSGAREGSDL